MPPLDAGFSSWCLSLAFASAAGFFGADIFDGLSLVDSQHFAAEILGYPVGTLGCTSKAK